MNTNFIDLIAAGESAQAKDALNDALSAKAFEALDAYKKEYAATIFGGQPEEVEQFEVEDNVEEQTEE